MRKEIKQLINKLEQNFAINECTNSELTCADCRATFIIKELKWLLTLED